MRKLMIAGLAALLASGTAQAAKDSLVLGMVLEPPVLDPTAGAAAAIREVVYQNIFEGLTKIDGAGTVQPALAKSWTIAPDGMTYTFALHTEAKFHDGAPFDCSVVKFTYERAVAPESTNAQKGKFEPIASVACPDPATAVITLKRVTGLFLFNIGLSDAVMISPASAAGNKTNPVGTGPYKFKNWVKGDRVELVRNDAYWGAKPAIATVAFRFIADPSAAAAAMLAGDIDAFPLFPAPETLDQFRKDKKFVVNIGTTAGKTIMSLNNTRKPFDDVRVRRALAYAIDRKTLVDALGNYGTPIGSHFVPSDPGFVDLTGAYPYDPAKAKALLAEAGIKPGFTMTLRLPPPPYARRGGEVIAAMLEQVGIIAKQEPVEWAQWLEQVFGKATNYDATIIAHVEPNDLDIYARDFYYFNYQSPEYRALYKSYVETVDPAKQLELVGQLQRKLSADEPAVFLFALAKVGVWKAGLRGLWTNQPVPANPIAGISWAD
jgi:peptide/nickel transport system substrate-binding protein